VSESLQVELNDGAVHAIDAPEEFTAHGPFHVELRNAGGPVHVHLRLAGGLSEVARLEGVNHYVGDETTNAVPVGVVPGREPVSGRIEIVSGYGAETAKVDVTVVPGTESGSNRSDASVEQPPEPPRGSGASAETAETRAADAEGGGDTRSARVTTKSSRQAGVTSGLGSGTQSRTRRAGRSRSDLRSRLLSLIETASPEELAFLGLAVVALVVGSAVILAVGELFLGLVVAGIVAAAVATAGWLLLQ
jgi:hypothetical protein